MAKAAYIIAGIGTDVGKTIVAAILTEAWQADYWKPVQAGSLDFTDTDYVRSLVSNAESKFHAEAYCFSQPMSPHAAAKIDNIEIDPSKLKLPETQNTLLIELAGGLMVPLKEDFLNIDLLEQWKLPVVLVSLNYLGSINHTLLSLELLEKRNIPVAGIIFNGDEVKATEEIILKYSKAKLLGTVRKLGEINKESIAEAAKSFATLRSQFVTR